MKEKTGYMKKDRILGVIALILVVTAWQWKNLVETSRSQTLKNIEVAYSTHTGVILTGGVLLITSLLYLLFHKRVKNRKPRRRTYFHHGDLPLSERGIEILNTPGGLPGEITKTVIEKGFKPDGTVDVYHNRKKLTFRSV